MVQSGATIFDCRGIIFEDSCGTNLAFLRGERNNLCPCFNVRNTEVCMPMFFWLTMVYIFNYNHDSINCHVHHLSWRRIVDGLCQGLLFELFSLMAGVLRDQFFFKNVRHFGIILRVPKCRWMLEEWEPAVRNAVLGSAILSIFSRRIAKYWV